MKGNQAPRINGAKDMAMSRLAIITARGGSKRIPKKNIRAFCGKPILAYSIQAAIESGLFDEVMVSTDSEEIADIAKEYGARVPFLRSDETSNDYATTAEVVREVLLQYQETGRSFDTCVCIYPTAPFITAGKLTRAVEKLEAEGADTVSPVVRFSFPPQRGFIISEGRTKPKFPEYITARSQDLEPMYHDCGQFYALRVTSFLEQNKIFMDKMMSIEVDECEVQDIDTESDWKIAEMKYQMMEK